MTYQYPFASSRSCVSQRKYHIGCQEGPDAFPRTVTVPDGRSPLSPQRTNGLGWLTAVPCRRTLAPARVSDVNQMALRTRYPTTSRRGRLHGRVIASEARPQSCPGRRSRRELARAPPPPPVKHASGTRRQHNQVAVGESCRTGVRPAQQFILVKSSSVSAWCMEVTRNRDAPAAHAWVGDWPGQPAS